MPPCRAAVVTIQGNLQREREKAKQVLFVEKQRLDAVKEDEYAQVKAKVSSCRTPSPDPWMLIPVLRRQCSTAARSSSRLWTWSTGCGIW